jgi:chitodextrinase
MATTVAPAVLRAAVLRGILVALAFTGLAAVSPAGGWAIGTARAADPVIAAAGDIACDPLDAHFNGGLGSGTAGSSNDVCRQAAVATTIEGIPNLQAVLDLGDNQYYCGGYQAFLGSYDKSWGAFKAITHPSVGNHEYLTSGGAPQATGCDPTNAGASGHYTYFGAAAGLPGQGYYSFNVGSWHLIALNSSCSGAGGCAASSPQGKWLAADLAANRAPCTLAYWHIPLFSSGGRASPNSQPFFAALYAAGADIVLNGHDHIYERFAPQTSTGALDAANGLREFIVGTGGANHTSIAAAAANSLLRDTTTFGALQLTLHAGSYDWKFLNSRGAFTDSGSGTCHRATTDTVAPTAPTNLTGTAASPTSVSLGWTGSTDNVGVSGYQVFRNGTSIGTTTTTSFSDTQATPSTTTTYSVAAFDVAGNQSTGNPTVNVTTPAAPDTTPPSKPVVSATAAATAVTLTWPPATDNVGVTRYDIARGGTVIGSVLQPASGNVTFTDSGLAPSTAYSYVVTAFDAAGNSAASAAVPVTTLAGGGSGGTTLTAVADAKVDASTPSTNFGTVALKVDNSPDVRSYLRFDASGISGTVQSAQLRIWATSAQSVGFDAYPVTDSTWTESGLTYANQPTAIGAKLGSSGAVTASTWKAIDVTSFVKNAGVYNFVLRTTSSTALSLSSREDTAHAPQLVLTTATAADTTPPTAPGTPAATAVDFSSATISWTRSSDDVGVVRYDVSRNGTVVGSVQQPASGNPTFSDSGLAPSTTYTYVVTAYDAAYNHTNSPSGSVTTTAAPDTSAPTAPGTPAATSVDSSSATISWTRSSDDVGVVRYDVSRNGTVVGTASQPASGDPTFSDSGLAASTTYSYVVTAYDAAGNHTPSAAGSVTTTAAPDTTAPSAPGTPAAMSVGPTTATISWTRSSDNVGVTRYDISRDGALVGTASQPASGDPTFSDTGLTAATTYGYVVTAYDAAGNHTASAAGPVTTAAAPDTTAPSAPGTPAATTVGSTTATISWTRSSDDVGVIRYDVIRDGTKVGSVLQPAAGDPSFSDTGLTASTAYSYVVTAFEAAGNHTDSPAGGVTTSAEADTTPPSAPGTPTASTVGTTTATITWTRSSDDVAVTTYDVLRDGTKVGTVQQPASGDPTFSDTGLTASTTYSYVVRAFDAAGNQADSPAGSVTTTAAPDTTPPSKPVVSATPTASSVALSWPRATDDVGVTRYDITRGTTMVGSVPQPASGNVTFTDTGLTASTAYSYVVTALDAAGNSTASDAVPVTTLAATGGTTTLTAIADAKVDASTPTTNFATTALRVDGSPDVRSYLKFDATGITGTVQSATLRIWATSAQSLGFDAYPVGDASWTEKGITYANQPSATIGAKLGSSGAVAASTWKTINVTAMVTGPGTYSVVLETTNATALALSSREDTAHAPQLVITTG